MLYYSIEYAPALGCYKVIIDGIGIGYAANYHEGEKMALFEFMLLMLKKRIKSMSQDAL